MDAPSYRTTLAGGRFRDSGAQSITISLEPEAPLVLEREPTNPYDPNAIQVLSEGVLIGYVPKNVAEELAPWLDAGWAYSCNAVGHLSPLMPFLRIEPIGDDETLERMADQ